MLNGFLSIALAILVVIVTKNKTATIEGDHLPKPHDTDGIWVDLFQVAIFSIIFYLLLTNAFEDAKPDDQEIPGISELRSLVTIFSS